MQKTPQGSSKTRVRFIIPEANSLVVSSNRTGKVRLDGYLFSVNLKPIEPRSGISANSKVQLLQEAVENGLDIDSDENGETEEG